MMSQDPAQGEPIEPEQDGTEQIIACAKHNGLAIDCIGAAGERICMIHTGVTDLWAVRRQLAGETNTWVVDHRTDETLRNMIVACRPDVYLTDEETSLFGGSDDE